MHRLKELLDHDNSANVNNIIYESVLEDKNQELKEVEDEFAMKKEEGVKEMKAKIAERKESMELMKVTKAKELQQEISEELKMKVVYSLTPASKRKQDISCLNLSSPKKVDFNSTNNTTVIFNTTLPAHIGLRKTFSHKKSVFQK